MTRNPRQRAGFTLIELLVVIALIILLASLTVGAVFRVLDARKETNTNTHLRKIHMSVEQQWKGKLDAIKKENPPQAVIEATRNADGTIDMARARAFHLKMRLRQEFPQNFADLFQPVPPLNYGGGSYVYKPKGSYQTAVGQPYMPAANTYVETSESQSAALLVLILTQGTGGATTDPETIAPTKLMTFLSQPATAGGQPGTYQLRVFVDAWGHHIAFRRFVDDDMTDVLNELNQQPFVSPSQMASGNMDPQDPEGRLKIPTWPNRATLKTWLAYPNANARPKLFEPFDGLNRGPFVFSAGKNGLESAGTLIPGFSGFFTPDDLYSFRIQQAGKGN